MRIMKASAAAAARGSSQQFTGDVWLVDLAQGEAPSRLLVAQVTFAPGARTWWHTHPRGQILVAVSGVGRVQRAGEPAHVLLPGDSATIAAGERHWHGAARDQMFVHLAAQEADQDGGQAHWLDAVTDGEYLGPADVD